MNDFCKQCKVTPICEWYDAYEHNDVLDFLSNAMTNDYPVQETTGYRLLENSCIQLDKLMLLAKMRNV